MTPQLKCARSSQNRSIYSCMQYVKLHTELKLLILNPKASVEWSNFVVILSSQLFQFLKMMNNQVSSTGFLCELNTFPKCRCFQVLFQNIQECTQATMLV